MVSIDAGFLGLFLHPAAKPPNDPTTGLPTVLARERVEQLIDDLDSKRERITIPAPALAEFLVLAADDGPNFLSEITLRANFYIQPFDQLAAIELAAIELQARKRGNKRFPLPASVPWQKVKIDRQILAIAKVHKAHTIYSDDGDLRALAEDIAIKAIACWELDLPKSRPSLFDNIDSPSGG